MYKRCLIHPSHIVRLEKFAAHCRKCERYSSVKVYVCYLNSLHRFLTEKEIEEHQCHNRDKWYAEFGEMPQLYVGAPKMPPKPDSNTVASHLTDSPKPKPKPDESEEETWP